MSKSWRYALHRTDHSFTAQHSYLATVRTEGRVDLASAGYIACVALLSIWKVYDNVFSEGQTHGIASRLNNPQLLSIGDICPD